MTSIRSCFAVALLALSFAWPARAQDNPAGKDKPALTLDLLIEVDAQPTTLVCIAHNNGDTPVRVPVWYSPENRLVFSRDGGPERATDFYGGPPPEGLAIKPHGSFTWRFPAFAVMVSMAQQRQLGNYRVWWEMHGVRSNEIRLLVLKHDSITDYTLEEATRELDELTRKEKRTPEEDGKVRLLKAWIRELQDAEVRKQKGAAPAKP